jgi:hypothetical protein
MTYMLQTKGMPLCSIVLVKDLNGSLFTENCQLKACPLYSCD